MPSRQKHTKSRLGCLTCKKRRVRCDMQRPVCQNCARLEKACGYADSSVLATSCRCARTESTSKSEGAGSLESGEIPSSITDETIPDLELMYHWSTQTSLTMTDDPLKRYIWQDVITRHAISHRFLLHGIFAQAALHRSQISLPIRRNYYVDLARKHHLQALNRYIPNLHNITRENCHALFGFSALIGALSYGLLQLSEEDEGKPEDFIKGVIDTFDLLQGAKLIATQAFEWIKAGDLEPLLNCSPTSTPTIPPMAWGPRIALEALLGHIKSIDHVETYNEYLPGTSIQEANQVYTTSIKELLSVLPTRNSHQPKIATVFNWPATVDLSYITLLKGREPTALIILSHYGTALCCLDEFWWLRGIGDRLQQAISATIDEKWRPYLTMATGTIPKGSMVSLKSDATEFI